MALRIGVREGFKTIQRNGSLFFLSLLVISISLFLLALFGLVTVNLYHFMNQLDEKIEIIAFLEDNADPEGLTTNILKISGIKEVIYVSADDALRTLQRELKDTEEVLKVFESNPLPASLRIKLTPLYRNTEKLKEVSSKVMLLRGIKETIYGGELVDQLKKITRVITIFDIGLLIIIIFSVIFVIFQTIKLTIFARSREIEIMKLVGASDSFIAIPFAFEGIVQGFLGGLIAFVLTIITSRLALSFFSNVFFPQWWFLLGIMASGVIFGIIGSSTALRKFLQ
jgi:cell division transport system permease protein